VTTPLALLTITEQPPLLAVATPVTNRPEFVAPEIFVPLNNHWKKAVDGSLVVTMTPAFPPV
jgi:hypothetical protein